MSQSDNDAQLRSRIPRCVQASSDAWTLTRAAALLSVSLEERGQARSVACQATTRELTRRRRHQATMHIWMNGRTDMLGHSMHCNKSPAAMIKTVYIRISTHTNTKPEASSLCLQASQRIAKQEAAELNGRTLDINTSKHLPSCWSHAGDIQRPRWARRFAGVLRGAR